MNDMHAGAATAANFAGIGVDNINRTVLFLVREQDDARDAENIKALAVQLMPGVRRVVTVTLDGMEVWALYRGGDGAAWQGAAVPASGVDLRRWLTDKLVDWAQSGAAQPSADMLADWRDGAAESRRLKRRGEAA